MTSNEWENLCIGFDEYDFQPLSICYNEEVKNQLIKQYQKAFKDVLIDLKDYEKLKNLMGTPIQDIMKRLKVLDALKRPMLYSERKKLGEEYIEWAKENKVSKTDLTNIITWCFCFKMKEWLNEG